jgi:hypothetical protein
MHFFLQNTVTSRFTSRKNWPRNLLSYKVCFLPRFFNDCTVSCYLSEGKRVASSVTSQADGLLCTWHPDFEEYLERKEGCCLTPRHIVSPIGPHPRKIGLQDTLAVRVDNVQPNHI